MNRSQAPWHVPVRAQDVPEAGLHLDLQADAAARAAVAAVATIPEVSRLEAVFDVARSGPSGLRVSGTVSATVRQVCVVTLDAITSEVREAIEVSFAGEGRRSDQPEDGELGEDVEELKGGTLDLGALAVEFLVLGLDPYPRKPDASFEPPPAETAADHPFSALARLKDGQNGKG